MTERGSPARAFLVALLAAMALAACGSENNRRPCDPLGDNFIGDPGFSTLFGSRSERQWHISEHSAGNSFEFAVDGGVLSIVKTGEEPWTIVSQAQEAPALAGKLVVLGAEIKLDLVDPIPAHGFKKGGGLSLSAKRNGKLLLSSQFDHEPHMGSSGWQAVRVVFAIPKGVDALRVGILHQAGGRLQIRNPSLRLVDTSAGHCAPSIQT